MGPSYNFWSCLVQINTKHVVQLLKMFNYLTLFKFLIKKKEKSLLTS